MSSVDLLPSLLHATGQEIPDWCEGKILPTFGDIGIDDGRDVYIVEAKSNPKFTALTKATAALIVGDFKLIHYLDGDSNGLEDELYNLANDPEERADLCTTNNKVAKDLKMMLIQKLYSVNQL